MACFVPLSLKKKYLLVFIWLRQVLVATSGPSSLTRDELQAPSIGSVGPQPLDQQGRLLLLSASVFSSVECV